MTRKIIHGIIIGFSSALLAIALSVTNNLDWLENPIWDNLVRTQSTPGPATDQISLIFLDQYSLDWGKEEMKLPWPWPREAYALIADFCNRGKAKAIIFDVVFSEPSKMSEDALLGTSIAKTPAFVSSVFLSNKKTTTSEWPKYIPDQHFTVFGLNTFMKNPAAKHIEMPYASFPIPEVATNSTILGNVYAVWDKDAIIRKVAPFRLFNNHLIPTLGLAAFLATNPSANIKLNKHNINIAGHIIPIDHSGRAILNFRGKSQTHKTVNAAAVIQSELQILENKKPVLDPALFKDQYVLLGFTAPALVDLKATPLSKTFPGVEVHATLLDNVLSSDFISDPPLSSQILITIILALIAGIAGRISTNTKQAIRTIIILLILPFIMGLIAFKSGYWLKTGVEEIAIGLALTGAILVNYALEGRQKRFIKNAFKQYLSPVVIERLVKDPGHLKLGGETRELSIFFSDVQGFTSISESLAPEPLTALLNQYLSAMTDIILREGGTIDKYEGDAIIAFWNAPLDLKDHAERAVRSALLCDKKLSELRPLFKEQTGKDLYARIGINTGKVVVGNMGSTQRFDYTFLGDAGNLASRLEGINKQFGTYIMISENTMQRLSSDFQSREISTVRVVGKSESIKVYEPMLKEIYETRKETINIFNTALKAYYNGDFRIALNKFSEISDIDPPAKAYAKRCNQFSTEPPDNWDGVWAMTEK